MPATFYMRKKPPKRNGRPSKLTPAVMAKIKEAFAYGLTDEQTASIVGVSEVTMTLWKRKPAFMAEIRGAVNERLIFRLKRIEAGENGWQGCGWILERLLPRQWAKPEILVAIQNNMQLNGAGGSSGMSLEQMVIADLQFEKLRQNPNYQHRNQEQGKVREVPGEIVVEPALSGTLARVDRPSSAIVSESQAAENERRVERSRKKIEDLLQARRSGSSEPAPEPSGNGSEPESSSEVTPGMITMPTGMPSQAWWAQLTTGSGDRKIEKAAAEWACSQLLGESFGSGQSARIQFDEDATVAEVVDAFERAAGSSARQMLVRKAGLA